MGYQLNQEIWLRMMEALIRRSPTQPTDDDLMRFTNKADQIVKMSVERFKEWT